MRGLTSFSEASEGVDDVLAPVSDDLFVLSVAGEDVLELEGLPPNGLPDELTTGQ